MRKQQSTAEAGILDALRAEGLTDEGRLELLLRLRGLATEASFPAYQRSLSSADPRVRAAALLGLNELGGGDAIDAMCSAVEQGHEYTVSFGAALLAKTGSEEAVRRLVIYAEQHSSEVHSADLPVLLNVATQFAPRRMTPVLERHLLDEDRGVREAAARNLLVAVGGPRAREAVQSAAGQLSWFQALPLRRALRSARP